CIQGLEFPWTF
nr:immunoglobulin light chain junction region [Macaca mulatta]MOV34086.1 immunoglobulin light chain junction region [Macaca mulatta]MOV34098.1 immunoglobulin light chain junction region [Macaca mulatta]MOV34099.1 immunoglobulin light chain junction region [Macaca mulatta]MOV34143.1 immunoglobulin light chain junction region [Macaca mulatta]